MCCFSSWTPCVVVLFAISSVSAADVGLPAEFVKECEYYLGDWATEVEIGGTVYRGTWTVKWSPDKTCLVTHWAADTPDGPENGTRVFGWDARAKKVLIVDFANDGASSIERYTITSNQVSEGEMSGVERDGKPFQATARAERKTSEFFTWMPRPALFVSTLPETIAPSEPSLTEIPRLLPLRSLPLTWTPADS